VQGRLSSALDPLRGQFRGVYENAGIGVRIPPESVYEIVRNPHSASLRSRPTGLRPAVDPTVVVRSVRTMKESALPSSRKERQPCLGDRDMAPSRSRINDEARSPVHRVERHIDG
jgi:hypothetical protein